MSFDDQANNPGFLMADIHRLLRRVYTQRTDENSLTQAQAKALLFISKHQGVKQRELANALEIQPMTMAKLLDHLEDQALIARKSDPNDRRAHQIHLTKAAGPHLRQIKKITHSLLSDMLQDLDTNEVEQLLLMLNKIRDRLLSL